jgi:hypothetical protein
MAFGLCGSPSTFQGAMNSTLAPLLRKCVLVFFDDILVYSTTLSEHLKHLRQVLQLLAKDQWQVKLSKCSFAPQQLSYLGSCLTWATLLVLMGFLVTLPKSKQHRLGPSLLM